MKILWVKLGGIVPLDTGGKIRSFNILKRLAWRHDVSIFTYYAESGEDGHAALNEEIGPTHTVTVPWPENGSLGYYWRYLRLLPRRDAFSMESYHTPAVRRGLRDLLERESFDLVLCDFVHPAPIIPWPQSCPVVIFTHNVEGMIWKRQLEVTRNPLWRFVYWQEFRKMTTAEHHYLPAADHVLTVSETDKDAFANIIPEEKLTVIPTGVDIDYFQPDEAAEEPGAIVFTGSMDWMPNQASVQFFVREVFPRILEQEPEATFYIVGRKPPEAIVALGRDTDRIVVTGRVEDIRPWLNKAAAYVVPLLSGSGTRIKIYEAMAAGKAIVSTTVGAEGLPIHDGEDIFLKDDPATMAKAVVTLLRNPEKRHAIGRAARKLVAENYSWDNTAEVFEKTLAQVVRNDA